MMIEVPLDQAGPQLVELVAELDRSRGSMVLMRNGREVARLQRARDLPETVARMTGEALDEAFRELRERVREHWSDEPEFDVLEAIQAGRR